MKSQYFEKQSVLSHFLKLIWNILGTLLSQPPLVACWSQQNLYCAFSAVSELAVIICGLEMNQWRCCEDECLPYKKIIRVPMQWWLHRSSRRRMSFTTEAALSCLRMFPWDLMKCYWELSFDRRNAAEWLEYCQTGTCCLFFECLFGKGILLTILIINE